MAHPLRKALRGEIAIDQFVTLYYYTRSELLTAACLPGSSYLRFAGVSPIAQQEFHSRSRVIEPIGY